LVVGAAAGCRRAARAPAQRAGLLGLLALRPDRRCPRRRLAPADRRGRGLRRRRLWCPRGLAAAPSGPHPARASRRPSAVPALLEFAADVVAFKYAQGFYGADRHAAQPWSMPASNSRRYSPGSGLPLVESRSALPASRVLFVGVPALAQFSYLQIRDFGTIVVRTLAKHVRGCEHLA
jgi:hypothetical protein